ncbi:hypothetical protein Esi_0034_0123 [Ectocarpus siliculosus]|uniref:Uncharacterized protein n=1 Tax=Ectocarpus siliculosus TaxID=2880 RepID=D7FY99_ECTSI|nr:hypothetical protein Esi_0034_0123 [Ectocarpus siliculosus]|eukprot:CBJ26538.1 hypothetical protein Esi_0034_0123 [Ectocarpus siliculosus]
MCSGGGEKRRMGRVRSTSMTASARLGFELNGDMIAFQPNAVRRRTISAGQMNPGKGGPDVGEALRSLLADATISTKKHDVKRSSTTVSCSNRLGVRPQAGDEQDLGAWLSDGVSVSAPAPAVRSTSPGFSPRHSSGGRRASAAGPTHAGAKPGRNEAQSKVRQPPARIQEGRGPAGAGVVGASMAAASSAQASQVGAGPAVASTHQAATATTTATTGGLSPSRNIAPPASTTLPTIGLVSGVACGGYGRGESNVVGCDDSKGASVAKGGEGGVLMGGAPAASATGDSSKVEWRSSARGGCYLDSEHDGDGPASARPANLERNMKVECEPNRKMTPEELAEDKLEMERMREGYRRRIRSAYTPVMSPVVGEGGAGHATPPSGRGNEKGAAAPAAAPAGGAHPDQETATPMNGRRSRPGMYRCHATTGLVGS